MSMVIPIGVLRMRSARAWLAGSVTAASEPPRAPGPAHTPGHQTAPFLYVATRADRPFVAGSSNSLM
ncbi:unnamed protein product [Parnassius apollo]|uniref:(apollo) hypothetical protein n=1 Tax=Parnassius apollo TaxID=110799 RepID=A0A8S3XGS4_PARAO|nr:unnamed protein product [Parnassius apollo]